MACGSCGGKGASPTSEWVVSVNGVQQEQRFATVAEARIWIGNNVKGVAAMVKAVPKR